MKYQPIIGLAALRNDQIGAFRAWTVARHLDPQGSGRADRREVIGYLAGKHATPRTRQRWTAQAIELGLFKPDKWNRYYHYCSLGKAAAIFQAPDIGRAVEDPESHLLFQRRDAGAFLWAGFLESLERDAPTSRETLARISGVPERTQRHFEAINDNVTAYPSFTVVGEIPAGADPAAYAQEYRCQFGGAFQLKGNKIVQQLPNVYGVKNVNRCKKGRMNKARKELSDLLQNQQVNDKPKRRYFKKAHNASKAAVKDGEPKFWHIAHDNGINWYGLAI